MPGPPKQATIIIAAWCAADFLERSVRSALAQEGVEVDVVIVDDASPDNTVAMAQELANSDQRVRVLARDENGGPAAARNAGIEIAKGEWIAVLDSDDKMRPGRLSDMIALAEETGADCVFDDLQAVDENGRALGQSHLAARGLDRPERWTLEHFLAGCLARPGVPALGYLKPVLRRDFLLTTDVRYDETLRNGEDFHLVAECLARGGALWVLPKVGYLYTQRSGSISRRLDPAHARALEEADDRFCGRHKHSLSVEARQLMQIRRRNLATLAAVEIAITAARTRRYRQAAKTLLSHPRAAVRVARQVFAKAHHKRATATSK